MADWLRPVFGRPKAQGVPNGSDRPASLSYDESIFAAESDDGNSVYASTPRLRPTSRVSSYIGIRSTTPPIPQTPETFSFQRNPESVYHEPSGDQMAEMLKVVMMNQSSFSPVPVEYNSTILHVLEAYEELRLQLRRREEAIEELKQSHLKDIEDFETLATQWEYKEKDYKSEMKKLEIMLSRTEGGLEQVTLARSKSTVHGAKVGERIGEDNCTIKARYDARSSRYRDQSDAAAELSTNLPANDRYRADRFFKTKIKTNLQEAPNNNEHLDAHLPKRVLHSHASAGSLAMLSSPAEMNEAMQLKITGPILSDRLLKELERQRAHEEFGMAFDSSSSDSRSSTGSYRRKNEASSPAMMPRGLSGLGIGYQGKPLPSTNKDARRNHSSQSSAESMTSIRCYDRISRDAPSQIAFSFRPGDEDVLAQRVRTPRKMPQRRSHQRQSAASSEQGVESSSIARDKLSETSHHSKTETTRTADRPGLTPRTSSQSRPREIQELETMERDDSSSSFVTALRDNSGRSSCNGTQTNSQPRRLDRNTGSSEAVTAAAKALIATRSDRIAGARCEVQLEPQALSQAVFAEFGTVIENPAPSVIPSSEVDLSRLPSNAAPANQGSALKYLDVTRMRDLYSSAPSQLPSRAVINMFVCAPRTLLVSRNPNSEGNFPVELLERHPFTTQTFIPLGLSAAEAHQARYLVIVAPSLPAGAPDQQRAVPSPELAHDSLPGRGLPDLQGIKAFLATGAQAVTYGAGTWHAPMVVVGRRPIDFVVVQFANNVPTEDCQETELGREDGQISVAVPVCPRTPASL
ncbi:ureidoglycolate hydrolase [Marssonina coronariae]|uniref:Ureidoglycolate hydrolase n=1 Tax=Diplocarpon coronariae TaxID=2795749 RepID=A0A218Z7F8_9HELO|nr:ureidoglycolate hydrolase [Marssonina coronariae]